jgi:hypothetical protein
MLAHRMRVLMCACTLMMTCVSAWWCVCIHVFKGERQRGEKGTEARGRAVVCTHRCLSRRHAALQLSQQGAAARTGCALRGMQNVWQRQGRLCCLY